MKHTQKNKDGEGFSLIEMLVVITIIGIIAAIALPNLSGITTAATNAKQTQNAATANALLNAAISIGWTPSSSPATDLAAGITVAGITFQCPTTGLTYSGGKFQ